MGRKNFKNSNKMIWNTDFSYLSWDTPRGSRKPWQSAREVNTLWFWSWLILWLMGRGSTAQHGCWVLLLAWKTGVGRVGIKAPPTETGVWEHGGKMIQSWACWVREAWGGGGGGHLGDTRLCSRVPPTQPVLLRAFHFPIQTVSLSIKRDMVKNPSSLNN